MMKIHAIQTGTVRTRRSQPNGSRGDGVLRLLNTLRDPEWTAPMPIYAWAIEHPEGLMVIDTGDTARTREPGYFPGWHPYYRFGVRMNVQPEDEIGPQLQVRGLDPADVRWLIMTHLHTDHAGGIGYFPKAEILLAHREYEAASGLTGRLFGYLNQYWPDWFHPTLVDYSGPAVGAFPASQPVTQAGDVHIVPTPGHAPGHQSVVLTHEDQTIFFAGDTSYSLDLLQAGVVDGVTQDTGTYRQTQARIRAFVDDRQAVYLPSHDPQSAARLEAALAPAETGIQISPPVPMPEGT
ncbi:MAG: N-acyl homoserine lactonase family protein [Anaerolineales bacterium]|jgi:N-acyl homoserine lactone hydrolase